MGTRDGLFSAIFLMGEFPGIFFLSKIVLFVEFNGILRNFWEFPKIIPRPIPDGNFQVSTKLDFLTILKYKSILPVRSTNILSIYFTIVFKLAGTYFHLVSVTGSRSRIARLCLTDARPGSS